jgi:HK97 family phage major capsid protein
MSKNLKALKEKRNALIQEMSTLADTVDKEVRSFSKAELSRISEIKAEVAALDSTIEGVKEVRSLAKVEDEGKGEKQHMELKDKEFEIRGMEQFLRGQYGEERRALTDANTAEGIGGEGGTAGQQGVTIPENVYGEIIELLGENAPVFEMARKFPSVTGNLKIAREDGQDDEGFIGETLDATKLKPVLKAVTLKQKRVAAALQLTNQLVNDSAVDIVEYSTRRLSRSAAKAIERGILIGAKSGEEADDTFRPIIGDANVLTHTVAAVDELTVEEILDIYGTLNPAYLDGAAWIVSRAVFNKMLKLKDGDGSYLVFRTIVEGRPGYTLLGCPVYVSDVLKDNATSQVVFGNITEGYGMLIKKDMNLVAVTADTTQALAGGRLYVLDAYMDGAVINPNAIVVAKKA